MRISDWSSDVCSADLRNGAPSGFAPLKALDASPANRDFLSAWLRQLVAPENGELGPQDLYQLNQALEAVYRLPQEARSLSAVRSQLDQTSLDGIGARLERWTRGKELGWVFDNEADTLELDARFAGFRSEEHTSELQSLMRLS